MKTLMGKQILSSWMSFLESIPVWPEFGPWAWLGRPTRVASQNLFQQENPSDLESVWAELKSSGRLGPVVVSKSCDSSFVSSPSQETLNIRIYLNRFSTENAGHGAKIQEGGNV